MRVFLAERTGTGARDDAWRPDITGVDEWGAFEVPDGRFVVVDPNGDTAPAGTVDFGDDPDDRDGRWRRLGEDCSGLTLGEALLTVSDNTIAPDRDGRIRIVVAGVELYDAPAIQGGAVDSFTYPDGALPTVSAGLWTNINANLRVVSNQVDSPGFGLARRTAAFTTDHYSQLDIVAQQATRSVGVWTRMPSAAVQTGMQYAVGANGNNELYLAVSGGYTQKYAVAGSNTGTFKLASSGSTHTLSRNGLTVTSVTDATLNANTYVGFAIDAPSGGPSATVDNWAGGDNTVTADHTFLGATAVTAMYLGSVALSKLHAGSIQVWPAS